MKKFYSIMLTATVLLFSIGMNAEVRTAGTVAELQFALADAENSDEIQLTADITLPSDHSVYLNITKSITLDGQGHTLSGYGKRGSAQQTIAINYNNSEKISVVLKNLNITTPGLRPIDTRGNLISLELDNVNIVSTAKSGNAQGITFSCDEGADAAIADLIIKNSSINATASGYPIIFWNPAHVIAENSTFVGYCGLYFKNGSRGSVVDADACNFDCPNVHSGVSNAFSCFPLADDGITLNLHNCGVNNQQIGDQNQALVTIGNDSRSDRREQPININISGDNSFINVGGGINKTFQNLWIWGPGNVQNNDFADINITITGGTYSSNPMVSEEEGNYDMAAYGHWVVENGQITRNVDIIAPTIPDGYEISEMTTNQNGQETTLYRVRKTITTAYNINDNVEEQGEGQNANTEFKITADDEIAENIDEVVANYVEVSNNATLTVGEGKTLEVTNGMDVKEGAQVVVEPGATLVVGEGGAIAEETSGIVIESSQSNPASFIMDPAVIVNTTPNLTVRMIANAGVLHIDDQEEWYWHRFAIPVNGISKAADFEASTPGITYVQYFDWTANAFNGAWKGIGGLSQLKPFIGYRLGYDLPYNDLTQQGTEMTYTFRGQLAGNQNTKLDFQHRGWNFFGNSYTAYVRTLTLLNEITGGDENIAGTIYLWNGEGFVGVTLNDLRNNNLTGREWMAEVAPMTTFILQLRGASSAEGEINYTTTIWENERYGRVPASAPARVINDDDMYARMIITSANGRKDDITLTENAKFTDEYDNGADANQFFNAGTVNVYANVAGEQLTSVATDNLEGKLITVNTTKDTRYTMSFVNVIGNKYAVKDMLTGTVINIADNSTYEFVADENSVNENRFMIVGRAEMPTDAEVVEATAAQKGIYTIMGQYIGETDIFNSLPAGVYVVDGVKVVK
jgi:hypothetical protein